jgi:hypothetical protein
MLFEALRLFIIGFQSNWLRFEFQMLQRIWSFISGCNGSVITPIILIQQRIYENDLAGMLLDQGGWKHLSLQVIAEDAKAFDLELRGVVHRKKRLSRNIENFAV